MVFYCKGFDKSFQSMKYYYNLPSEEEIDALLEEKRNASKEKEDDKNKDNSKPKEEQKEERKEDVEKKNL
jgi:hypothetical protein